MLSCSCFPLHSKKVCYKVSLCDNCQRQSCKAFIGLTNRANMIGGGDPFYMKFWIKLTALERNRRFLLIFAKPLKSCSNVQSVVMARYSHKGHDTIRYNITQNIAIRYDTIRSKSASLYVRTACC